MKAWVLILLAATVTALLIAAWIDGGTQPLRPIEQPVAIPVER